MAESVPFLISEQMHRSQTADIMDKWRREKLIQEVKIHPCLYDCKHPDYTQRAYKRKLWEAIGTGLKTPSEHARKEWNKMRNSYINHRGKKFPLVSTEDKLLSFLDRYIIPPKTQNRSVMELPVPPMKSNSSTGTIVPASLNNNFNYAKPTTTSNVMPSSSTASTNKCWKNNSAYDYFMTNKPGPANIQNWHGMQPPFPSRKSDSSTGTMVPATSSNNSNPEKSATTSNVMPTSTTTSTNTSLSTLHDGRGPDKLDLIFKFLLQKVRNLPETKQDDVIYQFETICEAAADEITQTSAPGELD